MRVFKYFNLPPIRICWEIFKGHSVCKEDFWTSQVWVFLKHDNLLTPIKCQTDDGVIIVDINIPNLAEGAYSLKAIWVKDGKASYDVPTLLEQGKRCVSEVSDVFFVSRDSDKISTDGLINLRSDAASYGYDGLSAYEKCYLLGKTSLTEEEWLDGMNSVVGWQPTPEQLVAINSGINRPGADEIARLKELGIYMDTNNDILKIAGQYYKLTRYKSEIGNDYRDPVVGLAYNAVSATTLTQSPSENTIVQKYVIAYDNGSYSEEKYADVSGAVVEYASSDETLATVNELGVVTWKSANDSVSGDKVVNITKTVTVNGKTARKIVVAKQMRKVQTYKVYFGSSDSEPTSIGETFKEMSTSVSVSIDTDFTARKRCHYVAYPAGAGIILSEWKDVDGDNLMNDIQEKTIGGYVVKYLLYGEDEGFISNTSNIVIKK